MSITMGYGEKFILVLTLLSSLAFARQPNEAEFRASAPLGDQIGTWVAQQNLRDKSVAVFSVIANDPFDQDYGGLVEAHVLSKLNQLNFEHASSCTECRSPQINIEGELLVIRKGTPDAATIRKVGERQQVEAFLTIDIYRSSFYVNAQASLYRNGTGELIGTEKFSEPALSLEDTSVMVLFTGGTGKAQGVVDNTYSFGANLMIVEELGFAKGGLSLGATLPSAGTLIYVCPTLAFTGRFGTTGLRYALTGGAGFGISGSSKGIAARFTGEVFLGSWVVVGAEYVMYGADTVTTGIPNGWMGLHLGFSFGR